MASPGASPRTGEAKDPPAALMSARSNSSPLGSAVLKRRLVRGAGPGAAPLEARHQEWDDVEAMAKSALQSEAPKVGTIPANFGVALLLSPAQEPAHLGDLL